MSIPTPNPEKETFRTFLTDNTNKINTSDTSPLTSITEDTFADTTSPESNLEGTNITNQTKERPISLENEILRAMQLNSNNLIHLADLKHQLDLYQKENPFVSFFEKFFNIGAFGNGYKQYQDIYDRLGPRQQIVDKLVDSYSTDNIDIVGLHLSDPERLYNGFVKNGLPSGQGIMREENKQGIMREKNKQDKLIKYSEGNFKDGKLDEGIITIQTDQYIRKIVIEKEKSILIKGNDKEIDFAGGKYYGPVNEQGQPEGFGVLTTKIKDKNETLVGTFNAGILIDGKMSSGGYTLYTLNLNSDLLKPLSNEETLILQSPEENDTKEGGKNRISDWMEVNKLFKDGKISPNGPDGLFIRETPTTKEICFFVEGNLINNIFISKEPMIRSEKLNGHGKINYKIPKEENGIRIFSLEGIFQNNALVEGTRVSQVDKKNDKGTISSEDIIEIGLFENGILTKGTKIFNNGTKLTSLDIESSELKKIIEEKSGSWFPFSNKEIVHDGIFIQDECDGLFIRETPTTKEICLFDRGQFKGSVAYPKTL